MRETIVAPATYLAESAVGMVRLSGERAIPLALGLLRRPSGERWKECEPRRLYLANFVNGDDQVLDEVMFSLFRAPNSYTGEDMVELYCHGNPRIVEAVVEVLVEAGARIAKPGEFTLRSFLNGKRDLLQAEAVLELVTSPSPAGRRMALNSLQGRLGNEVKTLRSMVVEMLSHCEACVDFPEEGLTPPPAEVTGKRLEALLQRLKTMVNSFSLGRIISQGAVTVLCGRPNVGKSSLLNALLKEPRAIVTPVPGTTRDVVEGELQTGEVTLLLRDLAGMGLPRDQAEEMGVSRAITEMENAHLLVVVLDSSQPLQEEDMKVMNKAAECSGKKLVALNKCDLPPRLNTGEVSQGLPQVPVLRVSALTGEGVEGLKRELKRLVSPGIAPNEVVITSMRQKECLKRAAEYVEGALKAIREGQSAEILSFELRGALACIDELTGQGAGPGILEEIFSRFCVGK